MKVELDKRYAMPAPADTAWRLLQDIEAVAGCMPGAKITERVDDRNYKGTVAVKFGPASMSFRGTVEIVQVDADARTLRLVGKGTDTTGSSGAAMDLTASVEAAEAASCTLVGHSEVSMSGKAATFGGRMMSSVAEQLLKQFAANFEAKVRALQAQAESPPVVAASTAADAAAPAPAPAAAPATVAAAPEPVPLNGLALAWAVFKDWLRSLFAVRQK
jgi:uncharacterized protein